MNFFVVLLGYFYSFFLFLRISILNWCYSWSNGAFSRASLPKEVLGVLSISLYYYYYFWIYLLYLKKKSEREPGKAEGGFPFFLFSFSTSTAITIVWFVFSFFVLFLLLLFLNFISRSIILLYKNEIAKPLEPISYVMAIYLYLITAFTIYIYRIKGLYWKGISKISWFSWSFEIVNLKILRLNHKHNRALKTSKRTFEIFIRSYYFPGVPLLLLSPPLPPFSPS